MTPLVVLHTSDLHNHIGLAEAGRLRNLRVEHQALLVDSGDAIWAGNVFVKPGPEQAIRRMNEAGYAAMAMGNREYFFRATGLLMKTAEARFPVLCANLLPRSGSLGHVQRWSILESPQGARVGFFGLSPLMIPPGSWAEPFSDLRFIGHDRATREALAALRPACDWVVCLSHIGFAADCALAERFADIDLILGGHSHTELEEPVVCNGVTLCHAGAYARRCELVVSLPGPRRAGFRRELLELRGRAADG
jgi:2',3'-cyclic-nucleotide 2'-phosphodiesterase (5'-nucleotidase family)